MSDKHLSSQFDTELTELSQAMLQMGGQVEQQLVIALEALAGFDSEKANTVLTIEKGVNQAERHIDENLSNIIARRQPAARDLRLLLAISKTTANLERVGDEACKIAKMVLLLIDHNGQRAMPYSDIRAEAELAVQLLRKALDALARLDTHAAEAILREDDALDAEYGGVLRKLITYMMEDARHISACIDLLFAAKSIERIGDHSKNIAEQIIYIVKGTDVRHSA